MLELESNLHDIYKLFLKAGALVFEHLDRFYNIYIAPFIVRSIYIIYYLYLSHSQFLSCCQIHLKKINKFLHIKLECAKKINIHYSIRVYKILSHIIMH